MEAPFDNSTKQNSTNLLNHTGEGVVIEIGTGDGRFVSAAARANPNRFYIGIDPNVKPLEKPSMKATRKPAKGGLPNALFIQPAIEDLPDELNGIAVGIHIHFPWGSLLSAVGGGNENVLSSLRKIAAPECLLEIVIGVDSDRDRSEVDRLALPELTPEYLQSSLIPKYESAGFQSVDHGFLNSRQWSALETSWAKKLSGNSQRIVTYLIFQAT